MISYDPSWFNQLDRTAVSLLIGLHDGTKIHVLFSQCVLSLDSAAKIEDELPGGLSVVGVGGPTGFTSGVKFSEDVLVVFEWEENGNLPRARVRANGILKPTSDPPKPQTVSFTNIVLKLPVLLHFQAANLDDACKNWFKEAVYLNRIEPTDDENIQIQHGFARICDFARVNKDDKTISGTLTLVAVVADLSEQDVQHAIVQSFARRVRLFLSLKRLSAIRKGRIGTQSILLPISSMLSNVGTEIWNHPINSVPLPTARYVRSISGPVLLLAVAAIMLAFFLKYLV
jgi:hypothetical protein